MSCMYHSTTSKHKIPVLKAIPSTIAEQIKYTNAGLATVG